MRFVSGLREAASSPILPASRAGKPAALALLLPPALTIRVASSASAQQILRAPNRSEASKRGLLSSGRAAFAHLVPLVIAAALMTGGPASPAAAQGGTPAPPPGWNAPLDSMSLGQSGDHRGPHKVFSRVNQTTTLVRSAQATEVNFTTAYSASGLIDNVQEVFPGQILDARSLQRDGHVSTLPTPRNPLRITVNRINTPQASYSGLVSQFSLNEFRGIHQRVLQSGVLGQVANTGWTFQTYDSIEEFLFRVGLNVSGYGAKIKNDLSLNNSQHVSVAVAQYYQPAYTWVVDPPPLRWNEYFVNPSATANYWGNGVIPALVRRVTFGKVAWVIAVSNAGRHELENTLRASYSGVGIDARLDSGITRRDVLETTRGTLLVLGGSAEASNRIITASPDALYTNFANAMRDGQNAVASLSNPQAVLSCDLLRISDGQPLRVGITAGWDALTELRYTNGVSVRLFSDYQDDVLEISDDTGRSLFSKRSGGAGIVNEFLNSPKYRRGSEGVTNLRVKLWNSRGNNPHAGLSLKLFREEEPVYQRWYENYRAPTGAWVAEYQLTINWYTGDVRVTPLMER